MGVSLKVLVGLQGLLAKSLLVHETNEDNLTVLWEYRESAWSISSRFEYML